MDAMTGDETFRLATAGEVEELLDRMAARVRAELGPAPAVVGIRRRGVPLARALAGRLGDSGDRAPRPGEITLERYSEDLEVLHERPRLGGSELPEGLEGETVLLVDDVLYSGRTLLRAVGRVAEAGAGRVHCAVLCSRGGSEVPVTADFVGLQLDVGERNIVEVRVPRYDDELAIDLRRRPSG